MALSVRPGQKAASSAPVSEPTRLQLLQRFELRCGGTAAVVPESVQRLLAFLALRCRPQHRATVAGVLWMDIPERRADGNLRTTIWRARKIERDLVQSDGAYLLIGPHVVVDLTNSLAVTRRLVDDPTAADEPGMTVDALCDDLLPAWYDDWVLLERERLRQIRLHGLEALCVRLTHLRRYSPAIEAGVLAAAEEPLRESAQFALISAHVAEGNLAEAVRQYDRYAVLLDEQLGIAPSDRLRALVRPCR